MKTFLGYVLLLMPALMQAKVHTTAGLPFDAMKSLSPQAIAQVITEFEDKTIVEPYDLVNKWRILHADMLKQRAQDYGQMAPNTDAPQLYRMLARRTRQLSRFMRRPRLNLTKDIQKSFENTRNWMALRARQQELMAQQYAVMAQQTTNKQVIDILNQKSSRHQQMAETIKESLSGKSTASEEQPTAAHIKTVEGTQLPVGNAK